MYRQPVNKYWKFESCTVFCHPLHVKHLVEGVDIFVIQLISVLESAEILPTRLKTQNNKSMYYSTISVYIILWSLSSRCSCIYNQLQQQNDVPL